MPSNKNRLNNTMERTGKNEIVYPAVSIVPALNKDGKVFYKIIEITFTLKGICVSIETIDKAENEFEALVKLNTALETTGIGDIKQMRKIVKELKEEAKS